MVGVAAAAIMALAIIAAAPSRTVKAPNPSTVPPPVVNVKEAGNVTAQPPVALPPVVDNKLFLPPPPATDGKFSDEADIGAPDIQVEEITYDGKSYQPAHLSIKAGDIVIFRNKSAVSFWPASSPHPQHSDYPELDPKKPIPAGQTFEFKFTKVGTWKFHDHLNPSAWGSVVVEK